MNSYTTNIKCCKELSSLVQVKKEKDKYTAICYDCGLKIIGSDNVKRIITDGTK